MERYSAISSIRSQRFRTIFLWSLTVIATWAVDATQANAQSLTVQEWVDQFVASCVGSGSSDTASGLVDANGDISLKRLTLSGNVKGQVQIAHKDARLLSEGITNAMSGVAADQANEVRQCMSPLRATLIAIMQTQFHPTGNFGQPAYVLTPDEDRVIRVLSQTDGDFHETGRIVAAGTIKSVLSLGDIRYRTTARLLEEKGYAHQMLSINGGQSLSLSERDDEYALRVGFVR